MIQPNEPDRNVSIPKGMYDRYQSMQWHEGHSRSLQRAVGDPLLWVGFMPWNGNWWVARETIVDIQIDSQFGLEVPPQRERMRLPFWPCVVRGQPIQPDDPRIPEHLLRCRFERDEIMDETRREVDADGSREAARDARVRAELRDRSRDVFSHVERTVLEPMSGFIGREGEGGSRKYYYDGALDRSGAGYIVRDRRGQREAIQ